VGISISLEARLPSRSLFALKKTKIDWEAEVLATMEEVMQEYGLADFIPNPGQDHSGRLPLHFCEEWGDVSVEKGKLSLGVRTSNCGPGYHAMICAAADAIEKKHKLRFYETETDDDETGYFKSRDFVALQSYFADWLPNLAESVVENLDGENSMRLQMPIDQILPDGKAGEILTPSGPTTSVYLKSIAAMNDDDRHKEAEKWFPWWNARPKAADFLKMAEAVMWVEIPWHAADNDWEQQIYTAALSGLSRAKLLGADVSHLQNERKELEQYSGQGEDREYPPLQEGIGYRRQVCRWPLTPSWTGLLPGYLREVSTEDNYQLYCDDFIVRLSSFSVEKNDDGFVDLGEENEHKIVARGTKEDFAWRIERAEDAEENGWLTSFVLSASKNSLLIASFTHNTAFDLSDMTAFVDGLVSSNREIK
jgi:hypothetical protein